MNKANRRCACLLRPVGVEIRILTPVHGHPACIGLEHAGIGSRCDECRAWAERELAWLLAHPEHPYLTSGSGYAIGYARNMHRKEDEE